ncbi:hypothetical protein HU200_066141 [Digitaria exilis]|uniref:RNase H type-1 domain-containing protein n=1 Tax=Digitaria exilis TaxID=1010633 RepID=A0A834ZX23_9POAL|nr:hypothetical protein HU200_066141 [Digitaria exilis]
MKVIGLLWAWRHARNKANAGEQMLSVEEVMYRAHSMSVDSLIDKQDSLVKPTKVKSQWCPPKYDFLNINFDSAFFQDRKSGAWGFVIRDHEGSALLAGVGKLSKIHDALCAEAQACLAAIIAAADQGMMQIQLESDSTVLVKAIKSDEYDHSLGGVLFIEAKFLISTQFASVEVDYVP